MAQFIISECPLFLKCNKSAEDIVKIFCIKFSSVSSIFLTDIHVFKQCMDMA